MKRRSSFLAAFAVALGALVTPTPAQAGLPPVLYDQVAQDREFVRWLSVQDPRAAVRSRARGALVNGGEAGITAFLFPTVLPSGEIKPSGFDAGAAQAADTRTRQTDYAARMATTHPAQFYPWVNAAARRAQAGTEAELAEFASTGYTAALNKDNAKIPYDDGAALVTPFDRAFVANLAVSDESDQVRDRAENVVTDADVAEFLRYGWLSAAGIDNEAFRSAYVADEWARWHEARRLIGVALTADEADARGAWQNVAAVTVPARDAWAEREPVAKIRMDAWLLASATAESQSNALWSNLVTKAPPMRTQWRNEGSNVAARLTWWNNLKQLAFAYAG
ncbi:hypothetical protein AB0M02_41440 [Actinoplanes sp. NPDC051861]|uniref:hypothetical protein n=1 Tax=Actinoplanes sp. NPDC051861 TaxID=3155170 RepID=UPI003432C255